METKFTKPLADVAVAADGTQIQGYASLWGAEDQGGDIVEPGAYAASLARLRASGDSIKLLWQHDPAQPIGVWDEVREDARGLYVKGRILPDVDQRQLRSFVRVNGRGGLAVAPTGSRRTGAEDEGDLSCNPFTGGPTSQR